MKDENLLALERLLWVATHFRLVDDYFVTPGLVQLYLGKVALAFEPEEAQLFLQAMIEGYHAAQGLLDERLLPSSRPPSSSSSAFR